MSYSRFTVFAFSFGLLVVALAAPANAQYPGNFSGLGFGSGFGNPWAYLGYGGYTGANARTLPYFSVYPPVYYSHSVPRPYGYSPFALPPGVEPAEALVQPVSQAQEIINPYVKQQPADRAPEPAEDKGVSRQTALHGPQIIVNPYYQKSGESDSRLARNAATKVD